MRQGFDGAAIEIAGGKIHLREVGLGAQGGVDQADALEELRPIDRRDQPHAGDDIAHRDVHRTLALNLAADDLVGGGVFGGEPVVQPAQGRRLLGIAVAQALRQLHGEFARPGDLIQGPALRRRRCVGAGAEQAICEGIGVHRRRQPHGNGLGDTAQVFDQRDAQGNRDGPKFADGERLDALIGLDETGELLYVEGAVGMRHHRPGDAEDARKAFERTFGQLGQAAIIAGRQVVLDLADLFVDDVIIVEQPFGGGRDGLSGARRLHDAAIGLAQNLGVVAQTCRERAALGEVRRNALRRRQTCRM